MDAFGLLFAVITITAWGTWLLPSEGISLPNPQARAFFVTLGNIILACAVMVFLDWQQLSWGSFIWPFVGGLIWSVSGYCAFTATYHLGIAKATGTWAPLNIITAIFWGVILFGEMRNAGGLILFFTFLALASIMGGILLIIFAGGTGNSGQAERSAGKGFLASVGAGFLWGSYFVPSAYFARNNLAISDWLAAFPLAVGMLAGSSILVVLSGRPPFCRTRREDLRALASGFMWSVGNFSMLLLVSRIGVGPGFTIAQTAVVVNGLCGIYLIGNPRPGTRAARRTLVGIAFAMAGAVALGNLRLA